jgi:hypothetical protein
MAPPGERICRFVLPARFVVANKLKHTGSPVKQSSSVLHGTSSSCRTIHLIPEAMPWSLVTPYFFEHVWGLHFNRYFRNLFNCARACGSRNPPQHRQSSTHPISGRKELFCFHFFELSALLTLLLSSSSVINDLAQPQEDDQPVRDASDSVRELNATLGDASTPKV